MNKTCLYSAIYGDYDNIKKVPVMPGVDNVLFTDKVGNDDKPNVNDKNWKIITLRDQFNNPRKMAKMIKLQPYRFVNQYKYSIWLDSSIEILKDDFADTMLSFIRNSNIKIALLEHFQKEKKSIVDEAKDIIRLNRWDAGEIKKQVNDYYRKGIPREHKIYGGTCIVRKHNDPLIRKFNQMWWAENVKYTLRDQISLPYVCWKLDLQPIAIPYSIWYERIKIHYHLINDSKLCNRT